MVVAPHTCPGGVGLGRRVASGRGAAVWVLALSCGMLAGCDALWDAVRGDADEQTSAADEADPADGDAGHGSVDDGADSDADGPSGRRSDGAPDDGADAAPEDGAGADGATPPRAQRPPPPPEPADAGACPDRDASDMGILVSPRRAVAGKPLRIVAATLADEAPLAMRLEQGEHPLKAELTYRPGVPSATIARLTAPEGSFRVIVGREGEGAACETVRVGRSASSTPRPAREDAVWPVKRRWDAAEEALFSAWVRETFHAPRAESLAWTRLDEVTSDASRNLLHNHHGWNEDDPDTRDVGLYLKPDCADTPYFLRAYYAWKRELPFAFRQCSRGRGGEAPHCGDLHSVVEPPEHPPDSGKIGELGMVQRYFRRTLAWGVHTGNGRCAFADSSSDFYPVALTRRSLRPGTMYADPYGHIFVVAELIDPVGTDPGVLYAIDGQPDGSITRKRFWEGNFLFNPDPALGGSGFKAFRPLDLVKGDEGPSLHAATNAEITKRKGYGDFSEEQSELDALSFYDTMDALITPGVRDPFVAQDEAIVALSEAAHVRVTSVDNGEAHVAKGGEVEMPWGYDIFETTGPWENFSTPARDLRLLIAIDVATGFSAKVARNPDAFGVAPGELDAVRAKLQAARDARLGDPELAITYERSNGKTQTLTLQELVARASAFETAYNPNDCVEVRWGAPAGSEERKSCRRRAPSDQQAKMKAYRIWFHDRRRPARGDPGPSVPGVEPPEERGR